MGSKNTHENVIFSCFGGLSNTGIVSALASLEAVKELGLNKVTMPLSCEIPLSLLGLQTVSDQVGRKRLHAAAHGYCGHRRIAILVFSDVAVITELAFNI